MGPTVLSSFSPLDFFDRLQGRRQRAREPIAPTNLEGAVRHDHAAAAHQVVGITGCLTCSAELTATRREVRERLGTVHHHDSEPSLAEALWILIRHARPLRVVETGVARGISTAYILGALELNGEGHLWSVDLPSFQLLRSRETAVAVPQDRRHRWTYIRGSSRRRLPSILARLNGLDLFVHDGLHTAENMSWEFGFVWPHLRADGFLVSDDVNANRSFSEFAVRHRRAPTLIADPDGTHVAGLLVKSAPL